LAISNVPGEELGPKPLSKLAIEITQPANNSAVNDLKEIRGSVLCRTGVVEKVQVRLKSSEAEKVSAWAEADWSESKTASEANRRDWKIALPKVRNGSYEVECRAKLTGETFAAYTGCFFSVDQTAPVINFFPLHDQVVLTDFFEIGGEIDKKARIEFMICRVSEAEDQKRYWNGSEWTARADDPGAKLRGTLSGDYWFPSAETGLPKAGRIESGTYLVSVFAFDRAGNEGRAAITVRAATGAIPKDSVELSHLEVSQPAEAQRQGHPAEQHRE
jgi:hypothetical protein